MHPRDRWIGALDGLRGLAALSVVAFHVWLYRDGEPATAAGGLDAVLSSLRVWFVAFFVLSGFLLAPHLRRWREDGLRGSLGTFAIRRARRILPAYWLAMAGSIVLLWGGSRADGIRIPAEPELLWTFVVLGQNYLPQTVMSVNPVTWTLSVEVAFYVLLPLLALGLRARVAVVALACIAATLAFNAAADAHGWALPARKSVGPFLGCFGLGLLAACVRAQLRAGATAALAALGTVLVVWWMRRGFVIADPSEDVAIGVLGQLPAAAGFALLVVALARGRGPLVRAFVTRPLRAAGDVSYGLFLWHVPVLLALQRAGDPPVVLLAAATLAISLAIAAASRRWIEQPALRPRRPARSSRPAARPRRAAPLGSAP
jgi:peptidoglycan/LPS O-acetylase OafA/YrhL